MPKFVLCLALCVTITAQANLHITEFMADNESSLRDEDGDYSDWIEIYNAGTTLQNLDGWSLTDDVSVPAKWRFPAGIQMAPDTYLIVFASDKNRTNAARLHTNFKLSAGGEYLGLIDPLGSAASEFSTSYPEQNPDISYGRDAGDFSLLLFFPVATPGARNVTGGAGFTPEVEFSRQSGTFSSIENFLLALSVSSTNAVIYYTFGTNVPSPTTFRYTNALLITNSTLVRARAFAPDLLPGPIASRTYVALSPDVLDFSSDLPIMVLHNFGQGPVLATGEDQYVAMFGFEPRLGRTGITNRPAHAERGTFHVRGLVTAVDSDKGKASFLLELQDELGSNKDVPLFGLPEESDWVLYAPNPLDRALFQNPLAHQLRRDLGGYSSRTRFFEMFLKDDRGGSGPITSGDYYGLFVLEERIKRDANRIDVEQLQPEHTNLPEISGGYIFSFDETNGAPQLIAGGTNMNWEYPSGFEMTNAFRAPQLNYIRDYFNQFNSALHSPNWTNSVLGYAAYIDADSWIDYHLHTVLTFNVDALRLSTYFYKPRNQRLQFGPPWDFDRSQGSAEMRDFNPLVWRSIRGSDYFNESPWWFKLFQDPDFWQRWIDRYQGQRDGPLSTNHIFALVDGFANELREAQLREQSRWDVFPRTGVTNSGDFVYNFGSIPIYDNEIRFKKHWYSLRLGFIDSQFLGRPTLTSTGGLVEAGFSVGILAPSQPGSRVLCTLDGSDPRLPGGGISPSAISNLGPVVLHITTNVHVVARSYNPAHHNATGPDHPPISSPWSGTVAATFYTGLPPLRITEIMYHPQSPPAPTLYDDEAFEFIEVKNIGGVSLNVRGFTLSGGVQFLFPNEVLQPSELAVIVADINAFAARYPWRPRVLGVFTNRLANAGDRLVLKGPAGEPILDFSYSDEWYPVTDSLGFSLVHKDPTAPPDTWNLKAYWRPSALPGAFPAADDPQPAQLPQVVINEVWTHADAIELLNLSSAPADIGGWFLTDDFRNPKKHMISDGTVLEPGGLMVFDGPTLGFALSASGEEVYLFSADEGTLTGYSHGFDFGAIESDRSFGRYITSSGGEQFPIQVTPTPGSANSEPRIGPIVITEIHYHPPDHVLGTNVFDNDEDEYVELVNTSEEVVALYDAESTNTWKLTEAASFAFPSNQSIPAGGFALVVGFDATNPSRVQALRDRYNIPSSVAIYGPFEGKLDNSSDRVELRRPIPPDPLVFSDPAPYSLVERVSYSDDPPWPSAADGLGRSLHRLDLHAYANDAANWAAEAPSPGRLWGGERYGAPIITNQPTNVTTAAYSLVTFAVSAGSPVPMEFQWRFNGRPIPGATNSTLVLQNVQPSDAGEYDVVVMNPFNSTNSAKAKLTILMPVQIAQQPQVQVLDMGANAYFSVVASGHLPITYQWRRNGIPISGETRPVLKLINISEADQALYDVAIGNPIGTVVSSNAALGIKLRGTLLAPTPPLQISAATGDVVTLGAQVHGTFPLWVRWRLFRPVGSQILRTETLPSPGPLPMVITQGTSFLTINVQSNSGGAYAVILTNAASAAQTAFTNVVLSVVVDSDGDLLPDSYETEMGLRADDRSDAAADLDRDGVSNRDEYIAGTDPRDTNSFLRIDSIIAGAGATLHFGAISNRTYTVQYTDGLSSDNWLRLTDVLARNTNRLETIFDPAQRTNRYYRVTTPVAR